MLIDNLIGVSLDWAVAKCEGYEIVRMWGNEITFLDRNGGGALKTKYINFSTNWAQGGPIIEREMIDIQCLPTKQGGFIWRTVNADGPTPLIAAMRCYVASKLGNNIEIPEGLNIV